MSESPLSVGMDSQGLGGSHGSSSFKLFKSDAKSVSTDMVNEEDNNNRSNVVDAMDLIDG